jgi:hypothetical protein
MKLSVTKFSPTSSFLSSNIPKELYFTSYDTGKIKCTKPPPLNPGYGCGYNQDSRRTSTVSPRDVLCSPVVCTTQSDWARCYQHNERRGVGDSFPAGWLHCAHCLQEINSSHLYTRENVQKRRPLVTSLLKVQYAAPDLVYNLLVKVANSCTSVYDSRNVVIYL